DLAHGVLQSMTLALGYRLRRMPGGGLISTRDPADSTAVPLTAVPETRAWVKLRLAQSEPGQFRLIGASRFNVPFSDSTSGDELLAVGAQASGLQPENAAVNARWARDPALARHVTVQPGVGEGLSAVGSRLSVR